MQDSVRDFQNYCIWKKSLKNNVFYFFFSLCSGSEQLIGTENNHNHACSWFKLSVILFLVFDIGKPATNSWKSLWTKGTIPSILHIKDSILSREFLCPIVSYSESSDQFCLLFPSNLQLGSRLGSDLSSLEFNSKITAVLMEGKTQKESETCRYQV